MRKRPLHTVAMLLALLTLVMLPTAAWASTTQRIYRLYNQWNGDHRDLHSFPTRRSSDLLLVVDAHAAVGNMTRVRSASSMATVCNGLFLMIPPLEQD